jgi:hypothetical protein
MTGAKQMLLRAALGTAVGAGALFVNDVWTTSPGHVVMKAEARIGRPLTPMSYAGVARRTTRRAYYGGAAAVGAAAVGAAAYGAYGAAGTSGCAQVVDAYGRLVTQCY